MALGWKGRTAVEVWWSRPGFSRYGVQRYQNHSKVFTTSVLFPQVACFCYIRWELLGTVLKTCLRAESSHTAVAENSVWKRRKKYLTYVSDGTNGIGVGYTGWLPNCTFPLQCLSLLVSQRKLCARECPPLRLRWVPNRIRYREVCTLVLLKRAFFANFKKNP